MALALSRRLAAAPDTPGFGARSLDLDVALVHAIDEAGPGVQRAIVAHRVPPRMAAD
ncbi:hypothetical protein [Streptomyces aureoversilis]|uniref:hypothetical protein n=1 Tax=Streptomyces aureoversilis TaxID=67277 RepID=UPI0036D34731